MILFVYVKKFTASNWGETCELLTQLRLGYFGKLMTVRICSLNILNINAVHPFMLLFLSLAFNFLNISPTNHQEQVFRTDNPNNNTAAVKHFKTLDYRNTEAGSTQSSTRRLISRVELLGWIFNFFQIGWAWFLPITDCILRGIITRYYFNTLVIIKTLLLLHHY